MVCRTSYGLWHAGFELSLIDEAYTSIADAGTDLAAQGWQTSSFLIFVRTIPGRFYPLAMLALQLLLILSQRDFGPMFKAEQRALQEGKVHADDADKGQVPPPPPFARVIPGTGRCRRRQGHLCTMQQQSVYILSLIHI